MVEDGCKVSYCIKSGIFNRKTLPPAQLPPFSEDLHYIDYNDDPALFIGRKNTLWIRDIEGLWRVANTAEVEEIEAAMELLDPPDPLDSPKPPDPLTGLTESTHCGLHLQ